MLLKIVFCILFVIIVLQKANAKPIPSEKIETLISKDGHKKKLTEVFENVDQINGIRTKRQVVQPKWLSGKDAPNAFVDSRVRVTDENLREAAAIRAAIQKTIDEDTFVVNPDQPSNTQTPPDTAPASTLAPTLAPTLPQHIPNTPAQTDFFKFSENQQKSKFPTFQMNFPFFETNFSPFQKAFKSSFPSFPSFVGSTKTQPESAAEPEPAPAAEANLQSSPPIDNPTESLAQNKLMAEFEKNWLEFVHNSKKMWSPEALAENEFIEEFKSLWLEFVEGSKEMMSWDFLDLLD